VLAAGPDLPLYSDGTPQETATELAKRNSAEVGEDGEPDRFDIDVVYTPADTKTKTGAFITATATAWDEVHTPFLNVLSNVTTRTVSARSATKAVPGIMPGWAAPLAVQKSFIDDDMKHRWGKPAMLMMIAADPGKAVKNELYYEIAYSDDPGDPTTNTANVVAIDIHNHGANGDYEAALQDYHDAIISGFTKDPTTGEYLVTNLSGNSLWVSSLKFRSDVINGFPVLSGPGSASQNWISQTSQAIIDAMAESTIDDDEAMDIGLGNIPHTDARFLALMLIDRTTGQATFDCQFVGYVGFFVQGLETDENGNVIAVKGFFCPASAEWTDEVTEMPGEVFNSLWIWKMTD